jgi:hypothetical protein
MGTAKTDQAIVEGERVRDYLNCVLHGDARGRPWPRSRTTAASSQRDNNNAVTPRGTPSLCIAQHMSSVEDIV